MINEALLDKLSSEGKLNKGGGYVFSYSDMEEAMDEARKDEAVEFGYWIVKEDWYHEVLGGVTIWYKEDDSEAGWTRHHSSEEVYQLFKNR